MIFLQFIASFIGVAAFSLNLEIPKKYIWIDGLLGAFGWVVYLLALKINNSQIMAYFLSALVVTIISMILARTLKVISTIFVVPGILPIVPGTAIYQTIYSLINNNLTDARYYLLQTILITGGIALAIFITSSIKDVEIIKRRKENENQI